MRKTSGIFLVLFGLVFFGAGCIGTTPSDAGVMRSRDGGRTFEAVNALPNNATLGNINVNSLLMNPKRPNEILAATNYGYYFTQNAGDQWSNVVFSDGIAKRAIMDPTNEQIVYMTLDEHIYKSTDAGKNFKKAYEDQTNPVSDIAMDANNHNHLFAVVESGNILVSNDAGESWRVTAFLKGTPTRLVLDPRNPRNMFVGTNTEGLYHSNDGGLSFAPVNLDLLLAKSPSVSHINDIAFNPYVSGDVVAVTDYGMIRSVDNGKTWGLVDTLVVPDTVPARTVAFHPAVRDTIFFTAGHKFYTSQDNGVTWALTDIPTTREIRNIVINPTNKNEIFIAINGVPRKTQPVDLIRFGN